MLRNIKLAQSLTGSCDVVLRVKSIELDHEVAILLVDIRCFGWVDAREELRQRVLFYLSYRLSIEPISSGCWHNYLRLFTHLLFRVFDLRLTA